MLKQLFGVLAIAILSIQSVFGVDFVKISNSPQIYICKSFLSEEECDSIIESGRKSLTRSTVVDDKSSKGLFDNRRSSLGTFILKKREPTAARKLRVLAEEVTGISQKNGEDLQLLYYGVGAEYQPHFDYFDPSTPGGFFHYHRGGQRVATLIVYLNTPVAGGETIFPKGGIKVFPVKGSAILFYNVDSNGDVDPRSFHGGAPVIEGEKWIATLWMRESEFR
jgi:prolyl 4-hydroxylase